MIFFRPSTQNCLRHYFEQRGQQSNIMSKAAARTSNRTSLTKKGKIFRLWKIFLTLIGISLCCVSSILFYGGVHKDPINGDDGYYARALNNMYHDDNNQLILSYKQENKVFNHPSSLKQLPKQKRRFSHRRRQQQQQRHQHRRTKIRVLMGIFTADYPKDRIYRMRQRRMFQIWDDPRVCALHELLQQHPQKYDSCELIYTFVVGANSDPNGPTQIVGANATDASSILANRPIMSKAPDLNDEDITLLNIRENMNEGKSQTWFYYASRIAEEHGVQYIMKADTDTALHLHEFFVFAYQNLISPLGVPMNNVFAGALRDKAYWPESHFTQKERIQYESFFGNNYEGVHLYLAGQCYLMSTQLAAFVAREAQHAHTYSEGHEDHDISAMVFHSPNPVHLITISRPQRFWEHPVKGDGRWKRIIRRETARMTSELFEGKLLHKDSSYDAVVVRRDSALLK